MSVLAFNVGVGGWVEFAHDAVSPEEFLVQFDESPSGRLEVVAIHLPTRARNPSDVLRAVPVAAIEALANSPVYIDEFRRAIMIDSQAARDATTGWLKAVVPLAGARAETHERLRRAFARSRSSLKLKVPETRKKPDEFYLRVAQTYSSLATVSQRPAAELAEANDVPATTVHRWLKEARRRGLLAPGQRRSGGE